MPGGAFAGAGRAGEERGEESEEWNRGPEAHFLLECPARVALP